MTATMATEPTPTLVNSDRPSDRCTCLYADTAYHDQLTQLGDDLEAVNLALDLFDCDIGIEWENFRHFVGSHQWANPQAAYEFAERVYHLHNLQHWNRRLHEARPYLERVLEG